MRTKVFITVDTEFSIAGAFGDPVRNKPAGVQAVLCEIDGKSHGLGFLLDTFLSYDIRATFFVEALNTCYFGDQPMRDLALRIKAGGHDVQLHLHPCWTYFRNPDWMSRLKSAPPTDHMDNRTVDQVRQWIADGIAIFERWGLDRPIALRTGSMIADRAVYEAMDQVGLRVASNIGLALYRPADPALHFYSGMHRVGGVLEACVLTYADFALGGRTHLKSLTITGSTLKETTTLLALAHEAGVESVVILTHAFEYVKYRRDDFSDLLPNAMNQRRLAGLCEFLSRNDRRFEATTMSALATTPLPAPSVANVLLRVPPQRMVERIVQNGLNNLIRY